MNTKLDSIAVAGIEMDAMENQGLITFVARARWLGGVDSEQVAGKRNANG